MSESSGSSEQGLRNCPSPIAFVRDQDSFPFDE